MSAFDGGCGYSPGDIVACRAFLGVMGGGIDL